MNTEVNYKNPKRYKTAKYPIRQPLFIVGLIWFLSRIMLIGKKRKLEKINMEGLKPPYILLSNHMHFIDFELGAMLTFPHRLNNVVSIDGYYHRPWLMELIGAICTRKFTMDLHLVKSIRKVLSRGDVLCMYPEARYSPSGITSYIPESVGMLIKKIRFPWWQWCTAAIIFTRHSGIISTKERFPSTPPQQKYLHPSRSR